ncbi:B3GALT4 (predicted) [Pycnogonum litorale]
MRYRNEYGLITKRKLSKDESSQTGNIVDNVQHENVHLESKTLRRPKQSKIQSLWNSVFRTNYLMKLPQYWPGLVLLSSSSIIFAYLFYRRSSMMVHTFRLSTENVNRHNFEYLVANENSCKGLEDLFALIVVHTAPGNNRKRDVIRRTWGDTLLYPEIKMLVRFFIGRSSNGSEHRMVLEEAHEHGDMVVQDYVDSYRNLSRKVISWQNWALKYCNSSSFVVKTDDDVFVNVFRLARLLRNSAVDEIRCKIRRYEIVHRNTSHKWYVEYEEYPNYYYPFYCHGFAYVIGKDVLPPLRDAWYRMKMFWIDDAFITGMLREAIGHELIDIIHLYKKNPWNIQESLKDGNIFSLIEERSHLLEDTWKWAVDNEFEDFAEI